MSESTVENISQATNEAAKKSMRNAEQVYKAGAEAMDQGTQAAADNARAGADTMNKSGSAAVAGLKDLTAAYQEMAQKNAERLTSSIQALTGVKSPIEWVTLQQKLVAEAVSAAIADSSNIAKLTAAVFTSALQPMKDQMNSH